MSSKVIETLAAHGFATRGFSTRFGCVVEYVAGCSCNGWRHKTENYQNAQTAHAAHQVAMLSAAGIECVDSEQQHHIHLHDRPEVRQ